MVDNIFIQIVGDGWNSQGNNLYFLFGKGNILFTVVKSEQKP